MKAVLPGFFSRGLVPNGVLVSQGDRAGVVGVVVDEAEVLEDLALLFNLAPVGPVVVDGDDSRPASCRNLFTVHIFDVHQEGKWAAFHVATEVVCRAQLAPVPTNKEVRGDILDVVRHVTQKKVKTKGKNEG